MKSLVVKLKNKYMTMSHMSRAALWFTIANFFNRGISFLTTPIISRMLTTAEYGTISVYNTWESILMIVATLNLFCGIQEVDIAKNKEKQNQVTGSLMTLSLTILAIFSVVVIVFKNYATTIFELDLRLLMIMLSDIGAVAVTNFWFTQKRFNYEYRVFSGVTMIKCLLRGILGITFVIWMPDDKVFGRIFGLALVDYLFAVPILIGILKRTEWKTITEYWMHAFRFNVILIPHYLSGSVLSSSDRIMISNMIGADKAGIYAMMTACASIVSLFYSAVNSAMTPFFLDCIKKKEYKALNKKTIQSIALIIAISLMIVLVAPEVLKVFAPSEYYEGVELIPFILFGMFLNFFYLIFSNFAFYHEKKYFITISTMISAIVNIILNYIFIPVFGYKVAAYTTVASYLLLAIGNYIVCQIIAKEKVFDIKIIALMMGGFLGLIVLSVTLYPYLLLRICLVLALAILTAINRKKVLVLFKK